MWPAGITTTIGSALPEAIRLSRIPRRGRPRSTTHRNPPPRAAEKRPGTRPRPCRIPAACRRASAGTSSASTNNTSPSDRPVRHVAQVGGLLSRDLDQAPRVGRSPRSYWGSCGSMTVTPSTWSCSDTPRRDRTDGCLPDFVFALSSSRGRHAHARQVAAAEPARLRPSWRGPGT